MIRFTLPLKSFIFKMFYVTFTGFFFLQLHSPAYILLKIITAYIEKRWSNNGNNSVNPRFEVASELIAVNVTEFGESLSFLLGSLGFLLEIMS